MAKSARASTRKSNNQRKKAKVFGPAETARVERLSARLLELAKQPKPEPGDMNMDDDVADKDDQDVTNDAPMELDSEKPSKPRADRKRIDKKKPKKSSLVFQKYSDRLAAKKKKGSK
ncbi:hypothetical protein S7711_06362 [Stachybotrys chartarum IBT 7711]|uniref:DUF2423 domain-containing protein n=1 Tax=Stachybotrys chartarum (strain CBS 109288 / IBT 7711) TaxID=1280523 RepID=A0A084AG89_STACB|nr:hypothetical protein S7711_06362 [Stachybotrys chartarum IBT 7711]KFA52907.1 hypothetical protein S40293_00990 [Stachybotrys chartarum IBT 40293]KFA75237.1 hypothetical protein S40288_00188 [Stachybotrys chartarum IBT 40288]